MKITILVENTKNNCNLKCEHGLSLLIEDGSRCVLFDTGASVNYFENAKILGIDIKAVDTLIISHGHNDHGGGLRKFLELNSKAKIYIGEGAFNRRENAVGKFIGLDDELKENERINFIGDFFDLGDGFYLRNFRNQNENIPVDKYFSYIEGKKENDKFSDEIYLIAPLKIGNVLFCGCAHRGIDNILNWCKEDNVKAVIGGLHTKGLAEKEDKYFFNLVKFIEKSKLDFYVGHCTGEPEIEILKKNCSEKITGIYTGMEFYLK